MAVSGRLLDVPGVDDQVEAVETQQRVGQGGRSEEGVVGGQERFLVGHRRPHGGRVRGPSLMRCPLRAGTQLQTSVAEDVALGVDDVVEDLLRAPPLAGTRILPAVSCKVRDSPGEGVDVAKELRDSGIHGR